MRILAPAQFGKLNFKDAAAMWLRDRKDSISRKTHSDYLYYIRCLSKFFAELPLCDIHIGHINSYIAERSESAGASCINHEINTVKQVLARAGLWVEIAKFYRPLRVGKPKVGQALDPEDEQRLFQVASSCYRWKIAYFCSIITATTTAGPKEITHLHLGDVDLGERPGAPFGTLRFRDGLKNEEYRERIVPLNESSRWACAQIITRYYKLCEELGIDRNPEHFILPGRSRSSTLHPSKPMGSWKKAWRGLRKTAGLPTLRMYDLRHHAITKLMEDPEISEQTIEDMAGHAISSRMKKRYSHIRMKPKHAAATKLELKLPPRSAERNGATREPEELPRFGMSNN